MENRVQAENHSFDREQASVLKARLTCPSLTSLKQYLNPECWLYVPPPLSVWAWTPPPAGAGAPADPEEEEEESVRRVGLNPETWNEGEETAQKQEISDRKTVREKCFCYLQHLVDLHTGFRRVLHSDLHQGGAGGCSNKVTIS